MAPGIGRINQHHVQIAGQTPMLKAIIEYQNLTLQFSHRGCRQGRTIDSLQMRHIGEVFL